MTTYRCPNCAQLTPEDICPDCGVLTEPLPELPQQATAADEPATAPIVAIAETVADAQLAARRAAEDRQAEEDRRADEQRAAARRAREEPRAQELVVASSPEPWELSNPSARSPARPAAETAVVPEAAQQELVHYANDGYEIFLIAGIAAAGKTQMLDAYRTDAFLSSFVKKGGMVKPTNPDELNCHPVQVGSRKVIFVDTSGENFKHLYPELSKTGEIREDDIEFLRVISRHLGGLVLLIDLQRLWNPAIRTPEDEAQIRILTWILVMLRWLRGGGRFTPGRIRFQDHVNREVMRMKRRLKAPVLALFSRADELAGLDLPAPSAQTWLGSSPAARSLLPVGEEPLLFAHHAVPELLAALAAHADHFRVDFAHSLVTDRDSGEIVDASSCGVSLSLEWLLDSSWRRPGPAISTRSWIALQRFVDEKIKRSRRWQRLPSPVEVR